MLSIFVFVVSACAVFGIMENILYFTVRFCYNGHCDNSVIKDAKLRYELSQRKLVEKVHFFNRTYFGRNLGEGRNPGYR